MQVVLHYEKKLRLFPVPWWIFGIFAVFKIFKSFVYSTIPVATSTFFGTLFGKHWITDYTLITNLIH